MKPNIWVLYVGLVGVAAFTIYYPVKFLMESLPHYFSGPEPWAQLRWIDETVLVPFSTRLAAFMLWVPTVIASQVMLMASVWLILLLIRGDYFTPRIVWLMKWIGVSGACAGGLSHVGLALNGWLVTSHNVVKPNLPIRPIYDSGEVGVFLVGLGLYLMAHVLHLTWLKDQENAGIV